MKGLIKFIIFIGVVGAAFYFFYIKAVTLKPEVAEPVGIETILGEKVFRWEIKAEMPTPRTEVAAAAIDNQIYVIGGIDHLARTVSTVEVYNIDTDEWRPGPSLPFEIHHATAVSDGDTIYVIGGLRGVTLDPKADVFSLDRGSNTWKRLASLPRPRGAFAADIWNGRIYTVGGVYSTGVTNDLVVYNIATDEWATKTPASISREHFGAAILDGQLYVAGGRDKGLSKHIGTSEIYDIATDTWRFGPEILTKRGGSVGSEINGFFLVIGGEAPTHTFGEVEGYDIKNDEWISLPPLPSPRHGLSAVSLDDKVYVIGGGKRPAFSVAGSNEVLIMEDL